MTEEQKPETHNLAPAGPEQPAEPADAAGTAMPAPVPEAPPAAVLVPRVERRRPSYVLLIVLAGTSLAADLVTKWWALHKLEKTLPSGDTVGVTKEITAWFSLVLARNRGGAWGLLQTADEHVRRPFFLLISLLAIVFIVSLYRRVHPQQHALKWGLPLVLGGALGNLIDRIRYSWVIDFIDMRGVWVRYLNEGIAKIWHSHAVTDHWPTYNVADIAICIGVGLMAIDMFTSRRLAKSAARESAPEAPSTAPTPAEPTVPSPTTSQPPAGPGV